MLLKTTSAAVALALVAGIASAQSINPGTQQLANIAGVDASLYTNAQLTELIAAQRDNDVERVNYILGKAGAGATRGATFETGTNAGDAQLAAYLGVEAGRFTTNELIQLEQARRDNDTNRVNFILSGANRAAPEAATSVSPGKAQIAAQLGVNPADYTTVELLQMIPQSNTN